MPMIEDLPAHLEIMGEGGEGSASPEKPAKKSTGKPATIPKGAHGKADIGADKPFSAADVTSADMVNQ